MPKFHVVIQIDDVATKEDADVWACSLLDTFFRPDGKKIAPSSSHPYKPTFVTSYPAEKEPRAINALFQDALRPLVDIANAFDTNNLDDEARRSWGPTGLENVNLTPADEIELYSGRGGQQLLTLADCFRARECVGGKGDTRNLLSTIPSRAEVEQIRKEAGNDPKVAKLLALIDVTPPGSVLEEEDHNRHDLMKEKGWR